jgi:hypothetical protein
VQTVITGAVCASVEITSVAQATRNPTQASTFPLSPGQKGPAAIFYPSELLSGRAARRAPPHSGGHLPVRLTHSATCVPRLLTGARAAVTAGRNCRR